MTLGISAVGWGVIGGTALGAGGAMLSGSGGSGGAGLGKDENLMLLRNKIELSNMGVDAGKTLEEFYKTGTFPDDQFTIAEPYAGKLGEYELSGLEGASSEMINRLIQAGAPELSQLGGQEYKELLTTDKYNPMADANKDTYFKPYKAEIMDQYSSLSDVYDRELAKTGDFYSTNRGTQQRELIEETGRQLNITIADLYKNYMNQRLTGAATAANLGTQEQNMELQRITAAQQQGQLERMLKDAEAKETYNEWLRQRSEYADLINTAKTLFSGTPTTSTFDQPGAGATYTTPSVGDAMLNWAGSTLTDYGSALSKGSTNSMLGSGSYSGNQNNYPGGTGSRFNTGIR